MTDKEKIRAEIERRIEELQPCNTRENLRAHGAIAGYYQILSFINSMQEEPVSEELEEACEQLAENARKHKAETSSPFFSQTDYIQGVMDGAKWKIAKLMKDATPVTVHIDAGGYPYIPQLELYDYNKDEPLAKKGDKYKVILIKED